MNLTENMLASDSFRQTCRGLGWNLNQRNEDRVEIPACHVCSHAARTNGSYYLVLLKVISERAEHAQQFNVLGSKAVLPGREG